MSRSRSAFDCCRRPIAISKMPSRTGRHGKKVTSIAEPVRKAMAGFDWPGNVRELRNLIESMIVQDQDGVLGMDDVQEGDSLGRLNLGDHSPARPDNLVGRPLNDVERF